MFLSAKSGFRTLHPRPCGVSPGSRLGLVGAAEGSRGRACVRACVRGSGRAHGAGRRGGAREARRAGQRQRTASSRQAPPRASREWFSPAPGSLCSSHAGPRWRRRWRPRACDHKEGAGGWTGARWRRLRPKPGPLPSASRPPSSGRPPRPRRRGPAPPPTARLAWCGGRARRHGGEAGAEAQVARGGRARRLPVAAAGLRECRPALPPTPSPQTPAPYSPLRLVGGPTEKRSDSSPQPSLGPPIPAPPDSRRPFPSPARRVGSGEPGPAEGAGWATETLRLRGAPEPGCRWSCGAGDPGSRGLDGRRACLSVLYDLTCRVCLCW